MLVRDQGLMGNRHYMLFNAQLYFEVFELYSCEYHKRYPTPVCLYDGCINSITEFEVVGQRGRGRPKKTWKDTINNDLRHWKLSRADPANRMEWRKKLRTNIGAVRPTLSGTDTLNE